MYCERIYTSVTPYLPLLFAYMLGKFKLYNTVLSTVVTMSYIISSALIHFITASLYSFTNLSIFFPS